MIPITTSMIDVVTNVSTSKATGTLVGNFDKPSAVPHAKGTETAIPIRDIKIVCVIT